MAEEINQEFQIEEAFQRLEEITARLEEPAAGLAESMRLYEEGVKLAEACRMNLEDVEKELQILSVKEDEA